MEMLRDNMNLTMDAGKIKSFVQGTLGCGCPEEVFRHIECEAQTHAQGIPLRYRVTIGRRLLIYIVQPDDMESLERTITGSIAAGRKERDSAGLNRFRLVLVATDSAEWRDLAERIFNAAKPDEKVHLHVLSAGAIPHF